jgi:hypothetical protein
VPETATDVTVTYLCRPSLCIFNALRRAPEILADFGHKAIRMIDMFAWIVLIIFSLSTLSVIVFLAVLPGMIANKRNYPWAEAVTVRGPGNVFPGKVESVLQAVCTGRTRTSAGCGREINRYIAVGRQAQPRRHGVSGSTACRKLRECRDLDEPCQRRPFHPEGPAASDHDHKLRQPILR